MLLLSRPRMWAALLQSQPGAQRLRLLRQMCATHPGRAEHLEGGGMCEPNGHRFAFAAADQHLKSGADTKREINAGEVFSKRN